MNELRNVEKSKNIGKGSEFLVGDVIDLLLNKIYGKTFK